jgi:hypothetical protein
MSIVDITTSIKLEIFVNRDQREEVLAEIIAVLGEWAETTQLPFDLRVD